MGALVKASWASAEKPELVYSAYSHFKKLFPL